MSIKNTVMPLGTGRQASLRLNITPKSKQIYAREPIKPSIGRVVGFYPSMKNDRPVGWESQLEHKACSLFEFSQIVVGYREQPVSIYFESQGQMRQYTPDFELTLKTGDLVYVEIKPAAKLSKPEIKSRLQDVAKFWKLQGHQFVVITDNELNHPDLLRNLKLLRSHLRYELTEDLIQLALHWVNTEEEPSFSELATYLGSPAKVYSLLAQGYLEVDLSLPLSAHTLIELPKESADESCLFSYRVAPDFA